MLGFFLRFFGAILIIPAVLVAAFVSLLAFDDWNSYGRTNSFFFWAGIFTVACAFIISGLLLISVAKALRLLGDIRDILQNGRG